MTESAGVCEADAPSILGWPTLVTPSIAQIDFGKAKSSALSVHFVTADGSVGGEAAIGA
jgi:hypothetical protein